MSSVKYFDQILQQWTYLAGKDAYYAPMVAQANSAVSMPALVGAVNGTNVTFAVPYGSYLINSLEIFVNGVFQAPATQNPTLGTFTLQTAPATGYEVVVKYAVASNTVAPASLIPNSQLTVLAGNIDALIVGTITRDANEAAISASVIWPDGSTGVYTATNLSTSFPGAVDGYTVTYTLGNKTITQPTVTRDAAGAVILRPQLGVA